MASNVGPELKSGSGRASVLGSDVMRLRRPTSSEMVLGLLCLMYLITYVDRVNIATAANEIKRELALSNTQLAFILSAFGYPYVVFQIFGGWVGDRVGARRTLFLCGLIWASATILTGFTGSIATLFLVRLLIGVGEGATFPVATRAMQAWCGCLRGFGTSATCRRNTHQLHPLNSNGSRTAGVA